MEFQKYEESDRRKTLAALEQIPGLGQPESMSEDERMIRLFAQCVELEIEAGTVQNILKALASNNRDNGHAERKIGRPRTAKEVEEEEKLRKKSRYRRVADALGGSGRFGGASIEAMARGLDPRLALVLPTATDDRPTPLTRTGLPFVKDLEAQHALAKEGLGGEEQIRQAGLSLLLTRDPAEWLGQLRFVSPIRH